MNQRLRSQGANPKAGGHRPRNGYWARNPCDCNRCYAAYNGSQQTQSTQLRSWASLIHTFDSGNDIWAKCSVHHLRKLRLSHDDGSVFVGRDHADHLMNFLPIKKLSHRHRSKGIVGDSEVKHRYCPLNSDVGSSFSAENLDKEVFDELDAKRLHCQSRTVPFPGSLVCVGNGASAVTDLPCTLPFLEAQNSPSDDE